MVELCLFHLCSHSTVHKDRRSMKNLIYKQGKIIFQHRDEIQSPLDQINYLF